MSHLFVSILALVAQQESAPADPGRGTGVAQPRVNRGILLDDRSQRPLQLAPWQEQRLLAYGRWGRCVVSYARDDAEVYARAEKAARRAAEKRLEPVFRAYGIERLQASSNPQVQRAAILDALRRG